MTYRVELHDLADACRKSGLRVVEIPGWREFGRPTGGFNPRAPQCHHTGGKDTNPESIADDRAYAEFLARIGRSDLPAPLCQLALDRTSTVYVCAAGRGNHAGEARAHGGLPAGDGNAMRLGIEAHNTGSEGWGHRGTDAAGNTITQYEGYVRLCAALCAHYGWDVDALAAHWETSVTGKWDPGDPDGIRLGSDRVLDMDRFRAEVARVMREGLDDVSAQDVWKHKVVEHDPSTKTEAMRAEVLLAQAHNRAGKAERHAKAAEAGVRAIGKALEALVPGVRAAVEDAVTEALKDATVQVDVNVAGGAEK